MRDVDVTPARKTKLNLSPPSKTRALSAAAANGSNRIVPRCPRLSGINALACLDDRYRPSCHSFTPRRSPKSPSNMQRSALSPLCSGRR